MSNLSFCQKGSLWWVLPVSKKVRGDTEPSCSRSMREIGSTERNWRTTSEGNDTCGTWRFRFRNSWETLKPLSPQSVSLLRPLGSNLLHMASEPKQLPGSPLMPSLCSCRAWRSSLNGIVTPPCFIWRNVYALVVLENSWNLSLAKFKGPLFKIRF